MGLASFHDGTLWRVTTPNTIYDKALYEKYLPYLTSFGLIIQLGQ